MTELHSASEHNAGERNPADQHPKGERPPDVETIAEEIVRLGHLGGPATMAMLTTRWRGATRQFHTLAPPNGWDDGSREDLLYEFLSERLEDLTDALVAVGADEEALLKRTSRIMKNWLIDQVRKTDTGAIRLRLEELLKADPAFLQVPGRAQRRWALAGVAGSEVDRDDEGSLVAAAMAVSDVKPVRWRDENRRAPLASGPDLTRILSAVLACAGPGGLEIGMLTRVFRRRFGVAIISLVPLDDDDTLFDRLVAPPAFDAGEEPAAAARAAEVYAQLSNRERRILLHLDDRRRVEQILGVGRSVAYQHIARVKAALSALAGEDLDIEALVVELVRLARGDAAPDDGQDATSEPSATADAKGAQRP